jgi:hypothetical protein
MRTEIKKVHQTVKTTTVYVTHDQVEAMTLADRVVVMNHGVIEQVGTPQELYHNPATRFVAGFIGSPGDELHAVPIIDGHRRRVWRCTSTDRSLLPVPPARVDRYGRTRAREMVLGLRPEHLFEYHEQGRPAGNASIEGRRGRADGHGNHGALLPSWAATRSAPASPETHCHPEQILPLTADMNNMHLMVDGNGRFETAWSNVVHRPSALCMTGGTCPLCFIGEVGPYLGSNRGFPNLGPRISILSTTGKLLARLGSETNAHGQAPGQFMSPHGIAVDSHGDIYVGEVSVASWPSLFPGQPRPDNLRSLQKLVKVP